MLVVGSKGTRKTVSRPPDAKSKLDENVTSHATSMNCGPDRCDEFAVRFLHVSSLTLAEVKQQTCRSMLRLGSRADNTLHDANEACRQ